MLFSRRRKPVGSPIEDFWVWWSEARPRVEAAIAVHEWSDDLVADIAARVQAIHPNLEWEFGKGSMAKHVLVVSGAGNSALRAVTERWRRAGPPADGTFEFAPARQADLSTMEAKLALDGHTVELAELRFAFEVDDSRAQVDVRVWHPDFVELSPDTRLRVTFLSLSWLLGEDGVEIWIGEITTATERPADAVSGTELATAVADLAAHHREPRWALLQGLVRGAPLIAMIQVPLKAARWPLLDTHIGLTVAYELANDAGFPIESSLEALRELEDRIIAYVDGAVVVAHETSAGVRTFHLYADGAVPAEAIKPLIASWSEGRTDMRVSPDPDWEKISHLRP